MVRKYGLVLTILLLAAALGWYLWQDSAWKNQPPVDVHQDRFVNQSTDRQPTTEQPLAEQAMRDEDSANKPNDGSNYTEQQQALLQEIDNRLFSDDPYVELMSLEFLVGQCRDQNVVDRLFVGKSTFYLDQQQLSESLQEQCQELRSQYPNFLSYAEHEQLIESFQPNSRMGNMLKQFGNSMLTPIDRQELSASLLRQAIREQNSSSLLYAVFIARFGSMSVLPMGAVINSKDNEYINQVSSMALMLTACQYQDGRACESTAYYMIITCSQEPAACNLSYQDWFLKSTLPGMQRDVEKLVAYFQQFGI